MGNWQLPSLGKVNLASIDPQDKGKFKTKRDTGKEMNRMRAELQDLQEKLAARRERALLIVVQGMDCSGKDGVIREVFSGVNPQGISSYSFKKPTALENSHDFLWRVHRHVPELGQIATFNRSHYEEVLINRVHGRVSDEEACRKFEQINQFESLLVDNGVELVKIFLHISPEFQLKKLRKRIENPHKHWKFDPSDIEERQHWGRYQAYYEEAMAACSTAKPWHVVPADHRWYRDYAALSITVETMRRMELKAPDPIPGMEKYLEQLKPLI
ncbi:polyphosphate kinase 2 family protein [Paenibacillus sp. IB182496]|uniref:Polyphosphate kinase 2 family protein n=1 Tax=Paenibacillus sabuli TaxID=2772509 RepID=A0A927BWL7_9BACL|nr:PPK2 family polyphosphate kinase [Paenibacillus sabuli]MBD2846698.1 polyphosphate kinase 2 family protein [Paenibacillus sabuli]